MAKNEKMEARPWEVGVRFVRTVEGLDVPVRATDGSAGVDLRAVEGGGLAPGERTLVDTGLRVAIPHGWVGDVRPRSSLAFKHGVTVLNTPGTIDSDYRGDVKVLLANLGEQYFEWRAGERIAQMVVTRVNMAPWLEVEELDDTYRGEGGFGSTGV